MRYTRYISLTEIGGTIYLHEVSANDNAGGAGMSRVPRPCAAVLTIRRVQEYCTAVCTDVHVCVVRGNEDQSLSLRGVVHLRFLEIAESLEPRRTGSGTCLMQDVASASRPRNMRRATTSAVSTIMSTSRSPPSKLCSRSSTLAASLLATFAC